ncbi:MAG: hypothetical protein V3T21_03405 [Candidatus Margulisiibacteriota bacterium]
MFRVAEVGWTQGAHKRGVQRPEYVLFRINRNKVAFGRSHDHLLTPSPVRNIKNERHLPMEEVLTGKTPQGYRLLENRDWEVAKVKPEEIAEHLRGRKEVFEKLPEKDVLKCIKDMVDIARGKLSRKILRSHDPELSPSRIQWVTLAAKAYTFLTPYDAEFRAEVTPPASFEELLSSMLISLPIDRRVLMDKEHHRELLFVLAHLRSVLFRIQKEIDRTKIEIAFQLPTISINSQNSLRTHQVVRLWIKSMLDEPDRTLRMVMTPQDLLRIKE